MTPSTGAARTERNSDLLAEHTPRERLHGVAESRWDITSRNEGLFGLGHLWHQAALAVELMEHPAARVLRYER